MEDKPLLRSSEERRSGKSVGCWSCERRSKRRGRNLALL
jgi:hypothetical protein